MKSQIHRAGAAALVFVLCLTVSPLTLARDRETREPRFEPGTRIAWVLKKLQRVFGGITSFNDIPNPPKP